ncbi:class I SAM-dependent methyltransferase [Novosphingobium sp.]|uniref:class I SAM-dependent methyltransferase n=1 Tax=Novosphingobium sp. TaxID=1874826 RepID=UPI0035B44B8B
MSDIEMEDWAGEIGDRWLMHIDRFESMIGQIGTALLDFAAFKPGERVVDVGCGGGPTTLGIARAVAPGGSVTGIDIAPQLISEAEQRRLAAGQDNCSFVCADAQRADLGAGAFDRLTSRFGVMFFEDSLAAFTNMRGWLKPGGDAVFACWGPPPENTWIALVGQVIGQFAEVPQRDPSGPGPFRFADPQATGAMLEAAGFSDVSFTPHRAEQPLGGAGSSPAEAAGFVLDSLAMRGVLEAQGGVVVARAEAALVEALTPYYRDGSVMMPGMSWFVRARNPG